MAVIVGKIQPLKKLKKSLQKKGIHRFNSIGDINLFLNNYDLELSNIPEIEKNKLDHQIHLFSKELELANEKRDKNVFFKIFFGIKVRILSYRMASLVNNYEKVLSKRCEKSIAELVLTRKTVNELYPLISGAVGENAVVNELKKLPDSFYVINDFVVKFNPPIYNSRENDRIYSIQIDHLLICNSGIFALETKNWNDHSVLNRDLRSPVEQIKRSSYALFVILNAETDFGLEKHHWGSKKVPIRNIIVMTNSVPKEEFMHVKVLSLKNLNGYLKYFDPIFTDAEVDRLFYHLNTNLNLNT
jgi:hypothetical protein